MRHQPSIPGAAWAAWKQALSRPHIVALLLAVNLLAAWVLAAPLKGLLASTLDHNLYGDLMAEGASWRWFDTVERTQPGAFGNLEAWSALFADQGLRWKELKTLAGPPAALALAGLLLFWFNAVLHCGFLAHLYPDRRGGFGAATIRFALPVSAFSFFALVVYVLIYAVFFVLTGKWLESWSQAVDSEWVALLATWARLAVTLFALLVAKLLFDLSKVVLVDRGTWNWPWAFLLGLRELGLRGRRYLALYLLLGLVAPVLTAAWWLATGWLEPQGWITLGLLFLLQQAFLAARITLRLAHLAATRSLYLEARTLAEAERPPYKVEPA